MVEIRLTIDGQAVSVPAGTTILEAARRAGIYIPVVCSHPDLPAAAGTDAVRTVYQGDMRLVNHRPGRKGEGCGICLVEVEGQVELVGACHTPVRTAMVVRTESERIRLARQEKLVPILARHRHSCLICAQQAGCPRTPCSSDVPENERCCSRFGRCELQDVANLVGISDATPKWVPTRIPILDDHPLFVRDYNLCIGCTRCVRACRELRGIEAVGFVYDAEGRVQVGTLAPSLEDSGCKFCTACVEVCPTGALTDKSVRSEKKEQDLVPCREACPAGIDIPAYLRLVAAGRRDEATAVIREKVPFPGVLGRVCFHPCETACRRGDLNDPVSICALKRYAADGDRGLWKRNMRRPGPSGRRVAVIGAGPAGLTAAYFLRKQGHDVDVFEAADRAGGMMRYGIPAFRLPREVLEHEIDAILDLGVRLHLNRRLGTDVTLDQLADDGFEAVFLAVGAQLSHRIAVDGCDLPDVLWGMDFLRSVAAGRAVVLKENVLVIGGGNVAVDVALTALRCGAANVSMASLEARDEMPAGPWRVESAVAEGVALLPSRGLERIIDRDGRVAGIDMVECTCAFDEKGNFCPRFGETRECFSVDQIIMAVGQTTDLSFLPPEGQVRVEDGLIRVDPETQETGQRGVYAGGDITRAPGAVIHAVAAGRRAAAAIDRVLGGGGEIEATLFERPEAQHRIGRDEGFAGRRREKMPELPPAGCRRSFKEVALGYGARGAVREAGRCLQCDLRLHLRGNPAPPQQCLAFIADSLKTVPQSEGVYQLLDEDHQVLVIKGTDNLRRELGEAMEDRHRAAWFGFEEGKMYSRRESELIQRYLQKHGKMPGGDDDLW